MRNKLALVLASLLMVGLLVPVAACKSSGGEVVLGSVLDLSGALAGMGDPISKAVQLAVKQVNDAGGINGAKVRLILEDGKTTPTDGFNAIKKLTEVDKVKVIIGPMISGAVMASGEYAAQHQVLLISPSATSPDISDQAWRSYVFRTAPSDLLQGRAMAKVAADAGYKKVVIFVMNNSYGLGIASVLTDEIPAGNVIKTITYDPTKLDYLTELQQIKTLAPDCVMHVGYGDDGDIVFKQALQLGLGNAHWITSEGVYGQSTLDNDAQAAQFMTASVLGTRAVAPEGWPAFSTFAAAYKAEYGKDPSVYCDNVYDAAMLALNAMKKVGTTDSAKIAAEVLKEAKNYNGTSGTITFDDDGNRVSSNYEVWNVVKDGSKFKFGRVKIISL